VLILAAVSISFIPETCAIKCFKNTSVRSLRTNVSSNRKPGYTHTNYEQKGENDLQETSGSVLVVFCTFIPEGRRDKKCIQCWNWKSALGENKLKIGAKKWDSIDGRTYIQALEL